MELLRRSHRRVPPPLTNSCVLIVYITHAVVCTGVSLLCVQGPFLVNTRNMFGSPVSFLAYHPLSAPPDVAPAQGYLRTIVQ